MPTDIPDDPDDLDLERPPQGVTFLWTDQGWMLLAQAGNGVLGCFLALLTMGFGFISTVALTVGFATGSFTFIVVPILFLAATAFMAAITIYSSLGGIRITADGAKGEIFYGVGGLGRKTVFDWTKIDRVSRGASPTLQPGDEAGTGRRRRASKSIRLEGMKTVQVNNPFGMLSEEKTAFIHQALHALHGRLSQR